MRIELVVGDWSSDGHGQTHSVWFEVTSSDKDGDVTENELRDAFIEGCAILDQEPNDPSFGEPSLPFCESYEDSIVPASFVVKLASHGVDVYDFFDGLDRADACPSIAGPDAWAQLWMAVAKIGNPNLDIVQCANKNSIRIGGYGLFY